ncbi:MAG: hypothetical protein LQ337_006488 [Flavoplaca oasis]|nr:MAG: hypothetical protein LQ337_006488 [Flavoplaca oasis]
MVISEVQILYLRLGDDAQISIFDDLYQGVVAQVASVSTAQEAKNAAVAQSLFATQSFKAVLIVDAGIAWPKNKPLQKQLASYAQQGGTIIFCCLFSNFVRPPNMDSLWSTFGLLWKYGDYHRTIFYLSQRMKNVLGQNRAVRLLKEYSMKANHLKNVPEESRVYVPLEQSQTQSAVFPPSSVDKCQTPAALHKYGEGWLGFIGDVNNERGTQVLLMAMLGKLSPILRYRRRRISWD